MTAPLAFVDCEATGVHPERRAWEIAVIRREVDGREKEDVWQVSDIDLSQADPFGLNVGRFYERHTHYSGRPHGVSSFPEHTVARFVEQATRGAHLVGLVPSFDAETLDPMLRRHQLVPAWHYHLIDVEAMAVGWLNGRHAMAEYGATDPRLPIRPPYKSDDLSLMCGVQPPVDDERHTALGDARWAMRWFDALTKPELIQKHSLVGAVTDGLEEYREKANG